MHIKCENCLAGNMEQGNKKTLKLHSERFRKAKKDALKCKIRFSKCVFAITAQRESETEAVLSWFLISSTRRSATSGKFCIKLFVTSLQSRL